MSDHFERLYTIGLTSKITLFKFSWIVSTNFFFILQIGFQKIEGNWWIHYSQYLSIKLSMFILKMIVNLVILNCFTISMEFSFSLNFLKTLPCWYGMWTIFFFSVKMISSYNYSWSIIRVLNLTQLSHYQSMSRAIAL